MRRPPPLGLPSAPGWAAPAAQGAVLEGLVLAPQGKPVEFANVTIAAIKRGAVTDEQGRFRMEVPAGMVTIEVNQLGYETNRMIVDVLESGPNTLRATLREEPIAISEVQVTASSFGKVGKSEGAVVRRI